MIYGNLRRSHNIYFGWRGVRCPQKQECFYAALILDLLIEDRLNAIAVRIEDESGVIEQTIFRMET